MSAVRGCISSADLSTAAAVTLFDESGGTVKLQANQRVRVYQCWIATQVTTLVIDVFFGGTLNDAHRIQTWAGFVAAQPSNVSFMPRGVAGAYGEVLAAKASAAGVLTVGFTGIIEEKN